MSDRLTLGSDVAVRQKPTQSRLLLTAAPFRIVRQDLFEIVKQSKLDQNFVGLLRHGNSYTGSVDRVVSFV
jgi:hypothetical protein